VNLNIDLSVRIGSLMLRNPVMTAAGTFGSGIEYSAFLDLSRLGAVVTKGVSSAPWSGNPGVRIAETASGMLNSIGLQNPGVEHFCAHDLAWLATRDVPVIVNVSGHTIDDYVRVVERLECEPAVSGLEINISCPNVDAGGMAFGTSCDSAAVVTRAVRSATSKTLIIKLSPNVTDVAVVARAVEAEGADAVSLINTLLGMAIDPATLRPVFTRRVAGLSGPAIKPVALRMVWDVASSVSVPVIGMGGIMNAGDAVEFIAAGATAIAVGTANFVEPRATIDIVEGLERFCVQLGVSKLSELIGVARRSIDA